MATRPNPATPVIVRFYVIGLIILLACGSISSPVPTLQPPVPTTTLSSQAELTGTPVSLPEFPWPPPKPSATADLTLGSVGDAAGAGATLGDVDSRIDEALAAGGYVEKSYYGVPGGFAIATALEQINPDGSPQTSNRWTSTLTPMSIQDFSLSQYLQALFGKQQGYYRVFVFIVTSNIVVQSGTPVTQGTAVIWVVSGANKLPDSMKALPYTKDFTCTAYVYEFVQPGMGEQANQNIPSTITGRQHLERAGLWQILEGQK